MGRSALIIALGLMILLVPAFSVDMVYLSYKAQITITEEEFCHERIEFTIRNEDTKSYPGLGFGLPLRSSNIVVRDNEMTLDHTVEDQRWSRVINIRFNKELAPNETRTVFIEFDTMEFIEPSKTSDDSYSFSSTFRLPLQVKRFNLVVDLPEGYLLPLSINAEPSQAMPVVQPMAAINTDGRKLFFEWKEENVFPNQVLYYNIRYKRPPEKRFTLFIIAYFIVVFTSLGFILGRISKRRIPILEQEPVMKEILHEDEKRIIRVLMENDGALKQNRLVKLSNYSKTKVSRLLADLEERRLIKKEPFGRTNKVYLTEVARNIMQK